jgi:hypothetical protein
MNGTQAAFGGRSTPSSRKHGATGFAVGLGLTASLALVSGAHAQSQTAPSGGARPSLPPNAIPLNVPGTYTLPPPPSGFDPQTASPAALQAYGFPPQPDKQANPKAYAAWLNAVSIPNRITPHLQKTNVYHPPLRTAPGSFTPPVGAGTADESSLIGNYAWSGYAVYNPAEPFQTEAVVGTYVAPVARNPFGQCPYYPYYDVYEGSWVGIDGFGSSVVFQNGTEADSYNDCAGSYQYYVAWLEWYPGPTYVLLDAPVEGGDYIFIENWTASTTSGCWFWANESEQWSASVCSSASSVGGSAVTGVSVEWIVERPYTGEHATGYGYLTNYVTIPWWETFAYNYTSGSPTYNYPGSAPSGAVYQIYSYDDSGGLISYPFLAGVDSIFFYDYGSAYCAPSASCVPRY